MSFAGSYVMRWINRLCEYRRVQVTSLISCRFLRSTGQEVQLRTEILAGLALLCGACGSAPADTKAAAAPACAVPILSTSNWRTWEPESFPVRLRLPKSFREKKYDITIGDYHGRTYHAGLFQSLNLQVSNGPTTVDWPSARQSHNTDYSECLDTVGGRPVFVQSKRGSGTMFWGREQSASYDVIAVWHLAPGRYLYANGVAGERRTQEELLAAIRTIEFVDR